MMTRQCVVAVDTADYDFNSGRNCNTTCTPFILNRDISLQILRSSSAGEST